jgi:hypothetical protein
VLHVVPKLVGRGVRLARLPLSGLRIL